MILTTTNNIEGYKIVEYKGVLHANTRSSELFSSVMPIDRALKNLEDEAVKNGCDAVIGISFISSGEFMDLDQVYGTGVRIEKIA